MLITSHLIPASTGLREYERLVVGSKDDIEDIFAESKEIVDADHIEIIG